MITTKKIKLLLVDDNIINLKLLENALKSPEYEFVSANSGKRALEVIDDNFKTLLLDIEMPGMDGIELASQIRDNEKLKNIPIIFVSAIEFTEEFQLRIKYLGDSVYFLSKPVDIDNLLFLVNSITGKIYNAK